MLSEREFNNKSQKKRELFIHVQREKNNKN